jgi:hypothetical protein
MVSTSTETRKIFDTVAESSAMEGLPSWNTHLADCAAPYGSIVIPLPFISKGTLSARFSHTPVAWRLEESALDSLFLR